MKRQTIALIILLTASLTVLSGCGATNTDTKATYEIGEPGTWTDGTYTETAKGKNGNFDVTVIIEDGTISSVTVGDNKETPDRGGVATTQLPDQIVQAQSYEISEFSRRWADAIPHCKRGTHGLRQTASWFEVNIHVRGTDFPMK